MMRICQQLKRVIVTPVVYPRLLNFFTLTFRALDTHCHQGRSRTSFIVLYVDTGRDTVNSMVPNMADVVAVVDLVIVPNTCTISFFVMAVSI